MLGFIKKLIPVSICLYLLLPIQYSAQSRIQGPSLLGNSSGKPDSDTTEEVTGEDDDYPSDTHGGAVRAFSQLVSADDSALSISSRSFANINGLNTGDGNGKEDIGASGAGYGLAQKDKAEEGNEDEDTENNSKLEGLEDDPQYYPLDEFYLYSYDEAVDEVDDNEGGRSRNSDFDDQEE